MTTHTDFILRGAVALALVLTLILGLFLAQPVQAATITVDNTTDGDDGDCDDGDCSLREAIADAQTGDTIDFSVTGVITLTSSLDITEDPTISGDGTHRVFCVSSGVTTELSALTIRDGYATNGSGGLDNDGTLTVINCTFSENAADYGGGMYNSGTVTMTNSTLGGNSAGNEGSGVYNDGTLHLRNTIIANSPSSGDCSGTLDTNTNNLIEDNTCSPTVSRDPNLGPLADNGGDTHTHALLPGSPAIDAGDNGTGATTDQRGVARVDGDGD